MESFSFERPARSVELLDLAVDRTSRDVSVGPVFISILADFFWQIEDNRDGQAVVLACQVDEGFACSWLDVGGVDYGEAAGR